MFLYFCHTRDDVYLLSAHGFELGENQRVLSSPVNNGRTKQIMSIPGLVRSETEPSW